MSNAHIEYCIVHHNTATRDGAGVRAVTCIPILNNNTISRNTASLTYGHGGGLEGNFTGVNNIIYGNYAAQNPEIYDGYFMFTYTCCGTSIPGTGNITSNPLWVNPDSSNFYLQATSPCIDTGSPTWPLDPDSTRADMGALYFDQSAPLVSITLEPAHPPIVIPASGGSFGFEISIQNLSSVQQTFSFWIMQILPDNSWQGPMLGPVTITLSAGFTLQRTRNQNVPRSAMPGVYTYIGYVGNYSTSAKWDSSFFNYTKLASGDGTLIENWENCGESVEFWMTPSASQPPPEFSSLCTYPNPFNPSTTLTFTVSNPGLTSLIISDLQGRPVAEVFSGYAEVGSHSVTFDGRDLPSGVYLARLYGSGKASMCKLLLIK
ncbi:MAG TPA: T9SS type A sorting domain-containing protein [bacterium]